MLFPRLTRRAALLLVFSAPAAFGQGLDALSLEQAVRIAIEHNHDLRLSSLAVASAEAAGVSAAAAPNPTLTLQTAGINPALGIGPGSLRNKTVDSTARIDQLIERGGKRALRGESAAQLEAAARADLRDALRQLRVGVSQAYYDVLAARERRAILRQTSALYDNTITAAQKRLRAGEIASADLARLQVDALRAQNDAAQGEADFNKMRQALALLLGQVGSARQIEPVDGWPAPPFDAAPPQIDVIEGRADVLAAQARVAAAVAGHKLALAARTRDVSVGLQVEHYPVGAANAQGSGNSYGIAVQIPLFLHYHFDGEIRAAQAALDMAQENLEKTRELARGQLLANWEDARAAADRLKRYDDSLLPAAKKSADAAEFAFTHGALNTMDVLDVRRNDRAVQLDAVAARAEYAKSLVAWQAAISESTTP
ncbi:cobalt-zinc-cadmium efflux system outer membrane protein [Oxalobacteraceae bacterium GrIS 1.11]